jgi:hypothetical protein
MRAIGWLLVAGCFKPDILPGDPCAADDHDWCPPPLTCSNHVCVHVGTPTMNVAFVTHDAYQLTIAPGGSAQDAADAICTHAASAAGLDGQFVAWLSTAGTDARDRFGADHGWYRSDQRPFGDTVASILAGAMYYPLDVDEHGQLITDPNPLVWTGTKVDGTPTFNTCNDFTSTDPAMYTEGGVATAELDAWTTTVDHIPCNGTARLYCFGIGASTTVPAPQRSPTARFAFLSARPFMPQSSVTDADSACIADARQAGLQGRYLALLALNNHPASNRFNPVGPWQRYDGVIIVSAQDLATVAGFDAPLDQDPTGAYIDEAAFTGATAINVAPQGGTCADWTSLAPGDVGTTVASAYSTFAAGSNFTDCFDGARLFCLQDDMGPP